MYKTLRQDREDPTLTTMGGSMADPAVRALVDLVVQHQQRKADVLLPRRHRTHVAQSCAAESSCARAARSSLADSSRSGSLRSSMPLANDSLSPLRRGTTCRWMWNTDWNAAFRR